MLKKLFMVCFLCVYGFMSQAEILSHPYWACVAFGQEDFGPTIGIIWQTVKGIGVSESKAREVALSRCENYGLKNCSIGVEHCLLIP